MIEFILYEHTGMREFLLHAPIHEARAYLEEHNDERLAMAYFDLWDAQYLWLQLSPEDEADPRCVSHTGPIVAHSAVAPGYQDWLTRSREWKDAFNDLDQEWWPRIAKYIREFMEGEFDEDIPIGFHELRYRLP